MDACIFSAPRCLACVNNIRLLTLSQSRDASLSEKIMFVTMKVLLVLAILLTKTEGEVTSACMQIPDRGPCNDDEPRYYFDQFSQECNEFSWGGCGGVTPFANFNECFNADCRKPAKDPCVRTPVTGFCKALIRQFFFDNRREVSAAFLKRCDCRAIYPHMRI